MRAGAWMHRRTAIRMVLLLTVALIAFGGATVGVNAAAGVSSGVYQPGHPVINLPAPASGSAAVTALAAHLPDVAKAYGLTAAELTYRFKTDSTLAVDKHGFLFYSDPAPKVSASEAAASTAFAPVADLADTFNLHSLLGAHRIIYLDFTGETLHACGWTDTKNHGADIVAPPFDLDGDPSSFSPDERTVIQEVWQRVAEDYASFNVDVTTAYTTEDAINRTDYSDDSYGMRVLISGIQSYFGPYGGIAYVGVYDSIGDYYKPALVFPEGLGWTEAKNLAEAASHEAGHSFNLYHDGNTTGKAYYDGEGTGETGWAPIMGVGYYKNLTQWSKGEYLNANNTEDDIAKIAGYVLFRVDDAANSIATETNLPDTGEVSGLVGANGDADVYWVSSHSGTLSVSASVASVGPDLDVLIELLDGNGKLIVSGNPVSLLPATLSADVLPGTYFIRIKGTGKGNPLVDGYTTYGSMGQYTISATIPSVDVNLPPVAAFVTDKTSGDPPLTVAFDASSSYDPEGTALTYTWDFGDGTAIDTASGAFVSHTFASQGSHTVNLTVTDTVGATGTMTTVITVLPPNVAPTAVISPTSASGYAPLTVNFTGASSSDTDGRIVSYSWTFSDGGTSTAVAPSRTYNTVGTYTASLIVTDDRGAKSPAAMATINVDQDPNKVLKATRTVTAVKVNGGYQAKAVVTVRNLNGALVPGVAVTGTFSGFVIGTASGTTGTSGTTLGIATILSKKVKTTGTVDFRITSVTKSGYVWVP